jgi:hypothetical protein
MNITPHPQRPTFTQAQLLQARYCGRVTEAMRRARREIPSFPIDNVTPDVLSDRDDGVFVEAEPRDGGYRVHVTIADVAAHISAGSPLATAAWQRAFTVYGPGWIDSMFPKMLEENLSLEHGQERLGLTVTITLDKRFQPLHTNFTPVITRPDSSSYAQAGERMAHDPQFQLMAEIARGVEEQYFGGREVAWREWNEQPRSRQSRTSYDPQAMQMVATYMLLANSCVAKFFAESGLPFLFRNFDGAAENAHAVYSTQAERHTALEGHGLKGAYCHFTSPIRRAPDYFNALMVHHAVTVLEPMVECLHRVSPTKDAKMLRQVVWDAGPKILSTIYGKADIPPVRMRAALGKLLKEALDAGQLRLDEKLIREAVQQMHFLPLPLKKEALERDAEHINMLSLSPYMREVSRLSERYERSVERIDGVEKYDKNSLQGVSPEAFSAMLSSATHTGDMPRKLFDETIRRLRQGQFDKVKDGASIFIDEPRQNKDVTPEQVKYAHRWHALKREVARRIKHDPAAVNALMERLMRAIQPANLQTLEMALPNGESSAYAENDERIRAALITMDEPGFPTFASPFYSVGHNMRAALSHARYMFLEHFAFNQLQPVEQTAMPNLLYAELDLAPEKKRDLLNRMVREAGAEITLRELPTEAGYLVHIEVKGGEFAVPLHVEAEAESPEDAEKTAIRRMLRHNNFKAVVSRNQGISKDVLDPRTVLEDWVQRSGGTIAFEVPTQQKRGAPQHHAIATMLLNGREQKFHGHGPNVDRAMRAACVKGLQSMGWQLDDTSGRSWVSDVTAIDSPSNKLPART